MPELLRVCFLGAGALLLSRALHHRDRRPLFVRRFIEYLLSHGIPVPPWLPAR